MRLTDEDWHTVIAVLKDKAEQQDREALTSTELLARQKCDIPDSPLITDLTEQVRVFEDDRDNLLRIASEFEVGLGEPAEYVD